MASPTYGWAYPTGAFVLSLIGGIFIILEGILYMAVGSILSLIPGAAGLIIALGVIALIIGLVIIYLAIRMRSDPGSARTYGIVVLVLSFISFVGGAGFFIGFLLALIGGILAIVWRPPAPPQPAYGMPLSPPMATPGGFVPPPPGVTGPQQKFCSHCGTANVATAQFCAKCGAPMG